MKLPKVKQLSSTIFLLPAAMLAGCASFEPLLLPTAQPDITSGYVAVSSFRVNKTGGFAFILRSIESGEEYTLPTAEGNFAEQNKIKDRVVAVKLPPGHYAVTHWATYGILVERSLLVNKALLEKSEFTEPFAVTAGSVVHLGKYSLASEATGYSFVTIKHSIASLQVTSTNARDEFIQAYPLFSKFALHCRGCSNALIEKTN